MSLTLTPRQEAEFEQARASDPAASAWVGASAGSGKTKVLTDRVLRLLLAARVRANAKAKAKARARWLPTMPVRCSTGRPRGE